MTAPVVSCVMVTRDRVRLAERALCCLVAQNWRPIELVVVDHGVDDYEPLLEAVRPLVPVRHVRVAPGASRPRLHNVALDHARGAYIARWDDDAWYHPHRLAVQIAALERSRAAAVLLRWTLTHAACRVEQGRGTPATLVHRRTAMRYADVGRDQEARFLRALSHEGDLAILGREHSHLFIGAGVPGERVRRTPLAALEHLLARIRGDRRRPAQLADSERRALDAYVAASRELGLLVNDAEPTCDSRRRRGTGSRSAAGAAAGSGAAGAASPG